MSKIAEIENIQTRDLTPEDYEKTQSRLQSIRLAAKNMLANFTFKDVVNNAQKKLREIILEYQRGNTKKYHLYKQIRDVLKEAHKDSFKLGLKSGGFTGDKIPKKEWTWFKQSFQEESRHIKKMVEQITSGKEKDPMQRVLNYLPALQAHYTSAKMYTIPYNIEIHWRLEGNHPDSATCPTCLWLFKHSPYTKDTLPTVPRAGHTRCFSNCRCNLVYKYISDVKQLDGIRKKHKSARNLLKQMKKAKVLPDYMLKQV